MATTQTVPGSRRWIRRGARLGVAALAAYGCLHLCSTAYFCLREQPRPEPPPRGHLDADRQLLASSLTRLLAEDGVEHASRWAEAIVRAAPTPDPGYVALIAAQIRRESHFLAPDLEWLYRRIVPDLLHELGMPDPVNTIGPMQVQRWRLRPLFERTLGVALDEHTTKELAYDLEAGVAACVAHLDPLLTEYVPDRAPLGWPQAYGPAPANPAAAGLAQSWNGALAPGRREAAAAQKQLSDLLGEPLAIDGVLGERAVEALRRFAHTRPELADEVTATATRLDAVPERLAAALCDAWQQRFGAPAPTAVEPTITHDPRLAFVFADFNVGGGACRIAALQFLLNDLLGETLAIDGIVGPRTRAAMGVWFGRSIDDGPRRDEFLALIESGAKARWVRDQALRQTSREFVTRHGRAAPAALVPDLWHDGTTRQLKGIGRISIEGYVAGSASFYEDYYARLLLYMGWRWPADRGRAPPTFQ